MKRRDFVQSLLAATAVSVAAPTSLPAQAADQHDNSGKDEVKPEEFAYAPGTITGPLARGLMPPDTPCPLPGQRFLVTDNHQACFSRDDSRRDDCAFQ